MDTNKTRDISREQFEAAYTAYCEKLGWKTYTAFHMLSEVYVRESTELAWQMWQASRQSVLVELPKKIHAGGPDDLIYWPADLIAAIEAQGLKVKP